MTVQIDWIPSTDDFAARLVLIRHEMGWNLKEAALACGIRAQSWREWELEHRKPRDYEGVCQQISERSGCNKVWLMSGYRPPPGGGAPRAPIPADESLLSGSNRRALAYLVPPLPAPRQSDDPAKPAAA